MIIKSIAILYGNRMGKSESESVLIRILRIWIDLDSKLNKEPLGLSHLVLDLNSFFVELMKLSKMSFSCFLMAKQVKILG